MSLAVEGYAALFGEIDREGDVVAAGAFRRTIARQAGAPTLLLLEHDPRLRAGAWVTLEEDTRGLFVRGRIETGSPAGALAVRRLARGLDGLSIGYRPVKSRLRPGGRDLLEIELVEISIVSEPMAPRARLTRVGWSDADLSRLGEAA